MSKQCKDPFAGMLMVLLLTLAQARGPVTAFNSRRAGRCTNEVGGS